MAVKLTNTGHGRDVAGLKYVYPVISRRAGGLSIGINLNVNNACNWRCIYCQVPGLVRGVAPEVDVPLLEYELRFILEQLRRGDFYDRFDVDLPNRRIRDIAISGNGEPTSAKEFAQVVSRVGNVLRETPFLVKAEYVLITNGSLLHRRQVQSGLQHLNEYRGQVWFKLDSATVAGRKFINNARITQAQYIDNLKSAAKLCPTWLQTCVLNIDGQEMSEAERKAYLDLLSKVLAEVKLQGVLLYTIARPSMQPEAGRLNKMTDTALSMLADAIKELGIEVKISG